MPRGWVRRICRAPGGGRSAPCRRCRRLVLDVEGGGVGLRRGRRGGRSRPSSMRSSVSRVTAQSAPSAAAASRAKLRAAAKSSRQGNSRTTSLSPAIWRAMSRVSSVTPVSMTRTRSTQSTTLRRASPMMSSLLPVRVVETIETPSAAKGVMPGVSIGAGRPSPQRPSPQPLSHCDGRGARDAETGVLWAVSPPVSGSGGIGTKSASRMGAGAASVASSAATRPVPAIATAAAARMSRSTSSGSSGGDSSGSTSAMGTVARKAARSQTP